MEKLIISIFMLFSSLVHASVYVVAHPDDAELFMSRHLIGDLNSGAKTIIVVATLGDAGAGNGVGANVYRKSYGAVRLDAHEVAVRFMMSGLIRSNNGDVHTAVPERTVSTELIAEKRINVISMGNVKLYNLMLPDGNGHGNGYTSTGNQSLTKLFNRSIPIIFSFDTFANSYSLAELELVLRQIVVSNMSGVSSVWINRQDNDIGTNPNDHADHLAISNITQNALNQLSCLNTALFVDYDTAKRPINLPTADIYNNFAVWGSLNGVLTTEGNPSTYRESHNKWLSRLYYREVHGYGNCQF